MFQFAQPLKMMEFTAFVEKQGAGENADSVSFSSVDSLNWYLYM